MSFWCGSILAEGRDLAEALGDHCIAQAFDVHGVARGEVEEFFAQAGGAVGVDASPVDLSFGSDEGAIALWAVRGEDNLLLVARWICGGDLRDRAMSCEL